MARFIKSKKQAIGVSPETLMFRGVKRSEVTRIRQISFDADTLVEEEVIDLPAFLKTINPHRTTWINIDGLHDEKFMQQIPELFDINHLVVADILNTHTQPRIYEYENCLFLTVKMPYYNDDQQIVHTEKLSLVIKENLLLTFQEKVGDMFDPVRHRIRSGRKRIRESGSDYLAFCLLDVIIDNYIQVVSEIGVHVESLDDELMDDHSHDIINRINKFKKEINYLRRVIKPFRELVLSYVKLDSDFIDDATRIYLKELEHNINMANDSVDSYREILADQLSVYHTNMSNRLNDVLKFLTIFSVLFIPITFIAGIYGTNFEYIPELGLKYGYLYMWMLIVLVTIGLVVYFKRKNWL